MNTLVSPETEDAFEIRLVSATMSTVYVTVDGKPKALSWAALASAARHNADPALKARYQKLFEKARDGATLMLPAHRVFSVCRSSAPFEISVLDGFHYYVLGERIITHDPLRRSDEGMNHRNFTSAHREALDRAGRYKSAAVVVVDNDGR